MATRSKSRNSSDTTANLGFEAKPTADALRNNMDAAEYKHVVLGIILLKYILDAFEAKHEVGTADFAVWTRNRARGHCTIAASSEQPC